ncbi:hypothetical protein [Shewanella algae]|uniref:hypothetical protein n=1 Tax=Shewanella algae TaxID=38313 RepID=UPI00235A156D|nr:hypothetical protein [Shewanella algae]MDC8852865.1 hypothetical protein [Shewanella algae]
MLMSPTYSIRIDFDPTAPAPERVFEAMALYVQGFNEIQAAFIYGFGKEVEFSSSLVSTREGSCIADICQTAIDKIRNVSFTRILDRIYLSIQREIASEGDLSNLDSIGDLAANILDSIVDDDNIYKQFTSPPDCQTDKLVNGLNKLHQARARLTDKDLVGFGRGRKFEPIHNSFSCPFTYDELLHTTETVTEHRSEETLIVRRPSFVEGLKWDCERPDGHKVTAKLTHTKWLNEWINRELEFWPGDALLAKVLRRKTVKKGKESTIETIIYEVVRVIPQSEVKQLTMESLDAKD